jgi:hypothetical protein
MQVNGIWVAFVVASPALRGSCANFQQLARCTLDAPAALRRHHAPEEIRHAAVRVIAFLSEAGDETL